MRKVLKNMLLPLLFGGIWFLVGMVVAVAFLLTGNPLHDYRLSQGCEVAQGAVRKAVLKSKTRINGRNPWLIRYTFEAAGGQSRDGRSYTSREAVVRGLKPGSRIEVEYLADNPLISRAKGTRHSLFPGWLFVVPVFFIVTGGMVFLWGIGKALRRRNLLVNGRVAVGKVTGQKLRKYINTGRGHPLDVFYSFEDHRRMEWTGWTRVYPTRPDAELASGDEVRIVYDAFNPRKSLAYELHGIDLSGGK
jgi:hypothetical protein